MVKRTVFIIPPRNTDGLPLLANPITICEMPSMERDP
jgi:hypothetical protein